MASLKKFLFLGVLCSYACSQDLAPDKEAPLITLQGSTMGTTWRAIIRQEVEQPANEAQMKFVIQESLDKVDRKMSTYKSNSDITKFNKAKPHQEIEIDFETASLLKFGLDLAKKTNGAFDPTILPLVNAWSFGPSTKTDEKPTKKILDEALDKIGWEKIKWSSDSKKISKDAEGVSLDFSSFAKGFGIDKAHQALIDLGMENFLLEVGGELRAKGEKKPGLPWKVAIEKPSDYSTFGEKLLIAVPLTDESIATSGDYRNFRTINGQRFSHIINPTTGYPSQSKTASVTVIAKKGMVADALATALVVLEVEAGIKLLQTYFPQAEALFILRQGEKLTTIQTNGFPNIDD